MSSVEAISPPITTTAIGERDSEPEPTLMANGSIANIIVVDAAGRRGVRIDWRRHARVGVPVTFATLAIAGAYLWLRLT